MTQRPIMPPSNFTIQYLWGQMRVDPPHNKKF
uniref:Uncharacterized protein n=1 Tax=Rhizophora mucronata TaxID=61149 RepID=A0A2P2QPY9_RHIMU